MQRLEEIFLSTTLAIMAAVVLGVILGVPVISYNGAEVTRKALNEQCGTNYSRMDVFLSGDTLKELCQIKNQELLIKQ